MTIYLLGKDNQPLLKGDEWEKIWITYRDGKNRFIQAGGIRPAELDTAVDRSLGSVIVSLPEGEWHVEIQPEGENGKLIAKTGKITVMKRSPLRVFVKPELESLKAKTKRR